MIRANNLRNGCDVDKDDVVHVTKRPADIQMLHNGDIVICMANGSSSLVGKNSYWAYDDKNYTVGAFCGIFRSSNPLVRWYMQSKLYKKAISKSLQGGNGAIANLNGDDILNITFPLPASVDVNKITSTFKIVSAYLKINSQLQKSYISQKHYLLQSLFI